MAKLLATDDKIKILFDEGLHLGHKKNRLHPKAKKFVYTIQNGVSIIDLTITAQQIEKAKEFIEKAIQEEKKILVVSTKKIANQFTADMCRELSLSHITSKWLPGLLTNFDTIIKNVKKLIDLKKERDEGLWNSFTKHEKGKRNKQIVRLEKFYGGLVNLEKKPDYLFVIDIKREHNAVTEAKKIGIPVVAIADTNANPHDVEYPIVANDDSASSVQYLVKEILGSFAKPTKKTAKIKE
ncbi:MAG: 30S ribosomal protein S2 [Patescibacteria group bacterium]